MSWDTHVVIAVPWHQPGPAMRDAVVCIAAFLPLSQESVASLFFLTLVTSNCAGRIPSQWGSCRLLGGLG